MHGTSPRRNHVPSPAGRTFRRAPRRRHGQLLPGRAPDGLLLIDAGLPGHLRQLRDYLTSSGRSLRDIRAVLLTHGHLDHTGLVTAVQQAGADIWIHESDAAILADGPRSSLRHAKPERSMLPYLPRRPAAIGGPVHIARMGGFIGKPVRGVHTFRGDRHLDEVPGRPQTVALPGHTFPGGPKAAAEQARHAGQR